MSSIHVSEAPMQTTMNDVKRPSGNFKPSMWGDYFLSCDSTLLLETDDIIRYDKMKEEIKQMLMLVVNKPLRDKLVLINVIQRLGVAYHFENEIDEILKQLYETQLDVDTLDDNNDLFIVSLRFRLFRQQGYKASSGVFNKFKDNNGNFKESLVSNVLDILELYEASHLRVHGEDVLEEAITFTTIHLKSFTTLDITLAAKIDKALNQPIRRALPMLEAKRYISIYEKDISHNKTLLNFAKMNFNNLQSLYRKELNEITKYWKDRDITTKLPFVRDRVTESYLWVLGGFSKPQLSSLRIMMTKLLFLVVIIDDMYDAYGTIEELKLFTDAIERWDIKNIDILPNYMKLCYMMIFEFYEEIEIEMIKRGTVYRTQYVKEKIKIQIEAYFAEAKWFNENYIPPREEYMPVTISSTAYHLFLTTAFAIKEDIVTKDMLDWVASNPKIVIASSIVCRFMGDIVSHKAEQERGHVASNVECYMKEYGVTTEEAYIGLKKEIEDAWKDINLELLKPTVLPISLLTFVLDLARVGHELYKVEDAFTINGKATEDAITQLFINSMDI